MSTKAIQTRYKGYHFRSRLEARWAVFFDAMGLEWEYEPEGFELPSGEWYLPDFFLPITYSDFPYESAGYWFEVKAATPTDCEIDRMVQLCIMTGHCGKMAYGQVGKNMLIEIYRDGKIFSNTIHAYNDIRPLMPSADPGLYNYIREFHCGGKLPIACGSRIEPDYDFNSSVYSARSARFEHGESGAT